MSEPQAAAPETKPLSLYVPEPEFRPGDKPDFSNVPIPKAGAARKPPVDVEAQEIHDLAYTIIRVMDDGPGVPPEQAERIFSPFVRLSDRLHDGVTGTGLGLTIARELARLHGGEPIAGT